MSLAPRENSWVAICNFGLLDFFVCGLHARDFVKVHSSKCASCFRKTLLFIILAGQIFTKPPLELSKVLRFQRKVPSAASPAVLGLGIASEDLTRRRLPNVRLPNSPCRLRKSILFRFSKILKFPGHDLLPQPKKTNGFLNFLFILSGFGQEFALFFCSRHRSVGLHLGHFILCVGVLPQPFIQFQRMKLSKVAAA